MGSETAAHASDQKSGDLSTPEPKEQDSLDASSSLFAIARRSQRAPQALTSHDILHLQRWIGNRAVDHLLQQRDDPWVMRQSQPRSPSRPRRRQQTGSRPAAPHGSGHPTPQPAAALPHATVTAFNTSGRPNTDNHCVLCRQISLGVGQNETASNGCEMVFTLSGNHAQFTYDIIQTKHHAILQYNQGFWAVFETSGSYIPDDETQDDESLTPSAAGQIFTVDVPGFASIHVPVSAAATQWSGDQATASPTATQIIWRGTFRTVVTARPRANPAATPQMVSSVQEWHSVVHLVQQGGDWLLNRSRSRIGTGALSGIATLP